MHSIEATLATGDASPEFLVVGNCDILIEGLSAGSVKLQYKLPPSTIKPTPAWTDFPGGEFTVDTYKSVFISEHGVTMRFLGVGNDSCYVRIARYLNK